MIIDADHREVPIGLAIKDRPFRHCVTGHVAMAIDVVQAEIEHGCRIEANSDESLQHVGRHFQHIDPVVRQQRQRQGRGTKIGARLGVPAGLFQDMRQQCCRRRFAVGAGDADKSCTRAGPANGLIQQFNIRYDRNARGDGARCYRVWLWQAMRNARRQHDGVKVEFAVAQITQRHTRYRGASGFGIVPGSNLGPHRPQGIGGGPPIRAQTNHGVAVTCKQIGRESGHRIFKVASPTNARIIDMIQNRMTMVGSAQPFFSKW